MSLPCACTTVRKVNRALSRFYENEMAGSGLSVTQFSIVRALNRNGDMPLSALADELVMERTSLYRTIAPLEAQGAVRIDAAATGRSKIATLTKAGVELMMRATPSWERAQTQVLGLLGEAEWEGLSKTLLNIPALVGEER